MNGPRETLQRMLGLTGADAGCERSMELFDQVVEAELAGRAPAEAFPEVAVHLEGCPDCREDYEGLRALVESIAGGASEDSP